MSMMENEVSVNERIKQLRDLMQDRGIDMYIVPTADDHASEYVGEHFKSRKFITGFTGSAGTAIITRDEAKLWTDGRYFVQAAKQIAGSEVELCKMGEPGVPKVIEYVEDKLLEGGCIGFDGSCMPGKDFEDYKGIADKKSGKIHQSEDLIDMLWSSRPALSKEPVWILGQQFVGTSASEKLATIREKMQEKDCDCHLVGSLYDIAYLTNLRGNDISHVPVFTSFLFVSMDKAYLYCFAEEWSEEVKTYLANEGIEIRAYDEIYKDVACFTSDCKGVLLNKEVINAKLLCSIDASCKIVDAMDPSELMRAIKNDTEVANTIEAHIHDGVAMTRFIRYVKTSVDEEPLTEISVSDELQKLREEQPGYVDLSFDTISAYGANAAMMHYSATPEDFAELKPEGFLLVDSGGQYFGGTTDITRTICLGPVTEKMKTLYTKVLQGNLRLANAKFPKGAVGQNLDVLARQPLWAMGLDYRCGTGHGVGHVLNVHEGPNNFRWRMTELKAVEPIVPGMITTDEPGYYEEGAFGIRIENELLCVEAEETEYGQYYQFQNLTYCPIDLDPVIPELLSDEEKSWLNEYHQQVYEVISPYLDEEEREWLQYETRAI